MSGKQDPIKLAETLIRQHEVFMVVDPGQPGQLDVGLYLGDDQAPDYFGVGTGRTISSATKKALWELYRDMGDDFDTGYITDAEGHVYIALKRGLKGGR